MRLSRKQQMIVNSLRELTVHPAKVIQAMPGEVQQRLQWRRGDDPGLWSQVDEAWDEHLHGLLDAPWPCPQAQQVDEIMADIDAQLAARGLKSGRFTYGWYSDAEILLCRAVWCVAAHIRPEVVIETGVAHGVTSRVVLEALNRNEFGHLWSIDLPFPFDHRLHGQTGVAVTDACRPRWSYLEGASSQRLPPLTAEVGHLEMFIHDSLHTGKNTLFEMEQAASVMSPGGVMLIDDVGGHQAFPTFVRRHPQYQTIICPSQDQAGIFGIAVKDRSAV
jgi:Methyltransferase domain